MRGEASGEMLARDSQRCREPGDVYPTSPGNDALDRHQQVRRDSADA